MHRVCFAILVLAATSLGSLVPACSSKSGVTSADASRDAGDGTDGGGISPNQGLGAPCDSTLSNPCLQSPACVSVACVAGANGTGTCVATPLGGACEDESDGGLVLDASIEDASVVAAGCQTNLDCNPASTGDGDAPGLYACAFSAFDGCSTTGTCVIPAPPSTADGAAETACGCDGQSVPYVTATLTSAPVASAAPCPAPSDDAGEDAATDAGDAGLDAPGDAADDR